MSIIKNYQSAKGTCKVTFSYPLTEGIKTVQVLGDFNNWDTKLAPKMKKGKSELSVALELATGNEYAFKYLLDGTKWDNDQNADKYVPSPFSGAHNGVIVIEKAVTPKAATPKAKAAAPKAKAAAPKAKAAAPKAKAAAPKAKAAAPKAKVAAPKAKVAAPSVSKTVKAAAPKIETVVKAATPKVTAPKAVKSVKTEVKTAKTVASAPKAVNAPKAVPSKAVKANAAVKK